jgi:hypothetical protein
MEYPPRMGHVYDIPTVESLRLGQRHGPTVHEFSAKKDGGSFNMGFFTNYHWLVTLNGW